MWVCSEGGFWHGARPPHKPMPAPPRPPPPSLFPSLGLIFSPAPPPRTRRYAGAPPANTSGYPYADDSGPDSDEDDVNNLEPPEATPSLLDDGSYDTTNNLSRAGARTGPSLRAIVAAFNTVQGLEIGAGRPADLYGAETLLVAVARKRLAVQGAAGYTPHPLAGPHVTRGLARIPPGFSPAQWYFPTVAAALAAYAAIAQRGTPEAVDEEQAALCALMRSTAPVFKWQAFLAEYKKTAPGAAARFRNQLPLASLFYLQTVSADESPTSLPPSLARAHARACARPSTHTDTHTFSYTLTHTHTHTNTQLTHHPFNHECLGLATHVARVSRGKQAGDSSRRCSCHRPRRGFARRPRVARPRQRRRR